MLSYLIAVILFLCIIHVLINYSPKGRMIRKIPGPPDYFIVGNALEFLTCSPVELLDLLRQYAKKWSDGFYRFWIFPYAVVNIYRPDDVELILSSMKHSDKSIVYQLLNKWLGNGLLLSNGHKWQLRRKILTPAFHFNILRQFYDILEQNSKHLVEELKMNEGMPVDILPVLSNFTLSSICETAMGTKLNDKIGNTSKVYKDALYNMGKLTCYRLCKTLLYPDFIFDRTSTGKKFNKYRDIAHSFTKNVIRERKEYANTHVMATVQEIQEDSITFYGKQKKIALLDLLITAEKDGLIDGVGVQEEVDTFMFEGHDTTASGLEFCFMLLANHCDIQDKIVQELSDIFGDSKRHATFEDLSKMKYLECVIKESLRLYPPVHFISRVLTEDITLHDYEIYKGTICHIHIYDLHRLADIYKDPLVFDPDRFLPENSIGRHPYAYIPFSAGPRNCIGQKFAMMEMKAVVSSVLREFRLHPVTRPSDIVLTADLILRNSTPIQVIFTKRTY